MRHMNVKRTRYSVAGLGKLGASMAAAIAGRGFEVIGVDVNASVIEAINAGQAPVSETGLANAIETNGARLRATAYHDEAVALTDVTFVVVPTPSAAIIPIARRKPGSAIRISTSRESTASIARPK